MDVQIPTNLVANPSSQQVIQVILREVKDWTVSFFLSPTPLSCCSDDLARKGLLPLWLVLTDWGQGNRQLRIFSFPLPAKTQTSLYLLTGEECCGPFPQTDGRRKCLERVKPLQMMNLIFHRKFFGHLLPLSNAGICRKTEFAEGLIACLAHFGNGSDALFPYSLQACLREAVLVTHCARGKMRTCFSHCFLLCCG